LKQLSSALEHTNRQTVLWAQSNLAASILSRPAASAAWASQQMTHCHLTNTSTACIRPPNFRLRALRHIRKHISETTAKTVACSMIDGLLDYYSSMLYRTSLANMNKLQRVQNSAARIVTKSSRSHQITAMIAELHCLPIQYQMQFKIVVTAFKVLTTQEPSYLTEVVRFHTPSRQLRSVRLQKSAMCRRCARSPSELSATLHSQC
jgi:hypothetical protein